MSFYRIRGGTPINDEKSQQRITDPNLLAALADINERFRIKREVQRQDAIDQANANSSLRSTSAPRNGKILLLMAIFLPLLQVLP